jgi:small ligand-binding sensory domain FIST
MRRSISFDYIAQRAQRLFEQIGDRRPVMALYIDCAGRASAYSGTDREEAEEVQKVIGSRVPLLGWYVGCEIAKAGSVMQSHNWTGVLSILSASH